MNLEIEETKIVVVDITGVVVSAMRELRKRELRDGRVLLDEAAEYITLQSGLSKDDVAELREILEDRARGMVVEVAEKTVELTRQIMEGEVDGDEAERLIEKLRVETESLAMLLGEEIGEPQPAVVTTRGH